MVMVSAPAKSPLPPPGVPPPPVGQEGAREVDVPVRETWKIPSFGAV
jgi:hypothetical protein